MTDLEKVKIKLGIEILYHNIIKVVLLLTAAACLGITKEIIILTIVFSFLRRYAFGLHAETGLGCTISTLIIFPAGVYASRLISLDNYWLIICYMLLIPLAYKYAPSDTEAHPLLDKDLRKSLRNKSVLVCALYCAVSFLTPVQPFRTLILVGVIFEIVSLHPFTYKIMKRRYKNYEKYGS